MTYEGQNMTTYTQKISTDKLTATTKGEKEKICKIFKEIIARGTIMEFTIKYRD